MKTLVLARMAAAIGILASVVLVASPASAAPRALPAGDNLYTIPCDSDKHPDGPLFSLDPTTAVATMIGAGTPSALPDCSGQGAWDATTGISYFVMWNGEDRLATIDTATGLTSVIGTFHSGISPIGGDSIAIGPDGGAFLISDDSLYSLELATANCTLIGTLGVAGQFLAFAADPTTGTFYAINLAGMIYTINTVTGAATQLSTLDLLPTNNSVHSLQIDSSGIFWIENNAQVGEGSESQLWSVDPVTPSTSDEFSGVIAQSGVAFNTESLLLTHPTIQPAAPTLPDTGLAAAPIAVGGLLLALTGLVFVAVRRRSTLV